ncbi:MAG: AraC family transcriptional regulator [Colwellia sp.]|jgi:AraC family transcriptional regulator
MDVEIVNFPETKVAAIEHHGWPKFEQESVKKLVLWRIENKLPPSDHHRSYGVHYNDPNKISPSDYRVDLCVSVVFDVVKNLYGVVTKVIPANRCAKVRHLGSRKNVTAATTLYEEWLPDSGEELAESPIFFHYVNVGSQVKESEMITDVYLPIL